MRLFAVIFFSLIPFLSFSQEEKLNDYLFTLYDNNKIMASATVLKKNSVEFERAYGKLNYKNSSSEQVNRYTKYRIGSSSKLFTAVLAMQLVEQGLLKLDDPLSKYFKDIPNANKISIRQLLNHHSGIADYTRSKNYMDWRLDEHSKESMLAKIRLAGTAFEPGKKGQYSNSNYVLLGYILEDLSGMNFPLLIQRNICERVGLNNTYYAMDATPERNEATSFTYSTNGWAHVPETHFSIPGGAGGMVSNPLEMCRFISALFNGKLLRESSLQEMLKMEDYFGLGIFEYKTAGRTLYGHTGNIDGFQSSVMYDPTTQTAVSICANGVNYNLKDATYDLYKISQGMPIGTPDVASIKIEKEKLDLYTGEFYSNELGSMLSIDHIDQTLMARLSGQAPFPLVPVRDTQFRYDLYEVQLDYANKEGTMYNTITLTQGSNVVVFERR
ncbi:MAG: serine hydrolase domain-containing protein [Luteibaculum sp.]